MGLKLYGATSGFVNLEAPAVADNSTFNIGERFAAPGLVLVRKVSFAGASSVPIDGVFTSAYKNYLIRFDAVSTVDADWDIRMRVAGVDNSSANYDRQVLTASSTAVSAARVTGGTSSRVFTVFTSGPNAYDIQVNSPAVAAKTSWRSDGIYGSGPSYLSYVGSHAVASAFDGFDFIAGAGVSSGDIYIYGYSETVGDGSAFAIPSGTVHLLTQDFTAQSTVSVDNVFSSLYDNYRVLLTASASSASYIYARLRTGGTDNSSALYARQRLIAYGGSVSAVSSLTDTRIEDMLHSNTSLNPYDFEFRGPAIAAVTSWTLAGGDSGNHVVGNGFFTTATQFDGITFYGPSGTITGSLTITGHRKA